MSATVFLGRLLNGKLKGLTLCCSLSSVCLSVCHGCIAAQLYGLLEN